MSLSLLWTCESETFDGTHDFSAGDNTPVAAFSASLGSAGGMVGTNGIIVASGGAQYRFDSDTSILDRLTGSVGFLFRAGTWAGGTVIWTIPGYGLQLFSTNQIRMFCGDPDGSPVAAVTTAANMTTGVIYGVIGRWDHAANLLRIEVYSDPLGTPALIEGVSNTSGYTAPESIVSENGLRFGDMSDVGFRGHFDNLFVSKVYAEPIQNNFGITSYTEYGSASSLLRAIADTSGGMQVLCGGMAA